MAKRDRYESAAPARDAFVPVKSDTIDLAVNTRGLWVGGAGDVVVIMAGDDDAVTFTAVPAGTLLPICVRRIYTTGTTATNLVGLE